MSTHCRPFCFYLKMLMRCRMAHRYTIRPGCQNNEKMRNLIVLSRCGPVTPYGDINLDQHWIRKRRVAWRHQASIWTNVDLPWVRPCDIHLRLISQEITQPSITKICLKITHLKFNQNLPGAKELNPPMGIPFPTKQWKKDRCCLELDIRTSSSPKQPHRDPYVNSTKPTRRRKGNYIFLWLYINMDLTQLTECMVQKK